MHLSVVRSVFRVLAALVVASSLVLAAAPAQAQSEEEQAKKVLALISSATKAFEAGDYATAEEKFAEAYELYPDPILLYRVGLAAEKQEKYRVALEKYEKFVAAMPDDATAQKVSKKLEKLRDKIPPGLVVTSRPEGAEVRLGGMGGDLLGVTPLETVLVPGEMKLYVSAEGHEPVERTVNLKAGETREIDIRLPVIDADAETDTGSNLGVYGWTSVGIGAALLATGGVFTVLSQNKAEEVNTYDKRAPGASPDELESLKDDANSYYTTSLIAYIAGGAVATTGLILIIADLSSSDDEESALQLDAGALPDRAWVSLRGTF